MAERIVIDTSVLIAALISETGAARKILRQCLLGEYKPLIGNALFNEYEDVSARRDILEKCPVSSNHIRDLLNAMHKTSDWVRVYFLWRPNLADEADNHVLELAVAGQATCIVTNNIRDFRNAQLQFPELEILTPAQFLKR